MRRVSVMSIVSLSAVLIGCNTKPTGGSGATAPSRAADTQSAAPSNAAPSVPAASFVLQGCGATFVNPMQLKWIEEYHKEKGVRAKYQSLGSSKGQNGAIDRTFDYGCSDAYLTDEMLKRAGDVGGDMLHIPLVLGAVVPTYNLPTVKEPLKFSQAALADIFLGKIKKWNDPVLEGLNPGVELPDLAIIVVHRSDGSGTTYQWTDALAKFSAEWKTIVGTGNEVKWPVGQGGKGNEGVAGTVNRTVGTIGYNELTYALANGLKYGKVQNQAGEFVEASLESVTAAAAEYLKDIPDDLRFTLTNAPGKKSYPISGTSWALIYKNQPAAKKQALVDFIRWQVNDGQRFCAETHFAPLPKELVDRINKKLDAVQAK